MTRVGKTFKDQKDRKAERGIKEEPRTERGGHHNLIREALEEAAWSEEEIKDYLQELEIDEDLG